MTENFEEDDKILGQKVLQIREERMIKPELMTLPDWKEIEKEARSQIIETMRANRQ